MDSLCQSLGEGKGSIICLCSWVLAKISRCSQLSPWAPRSGPSSMEGSEWWDFLTVWLASPRVSIPRELVGQCMAFPDQASGSRGITFAAFCESKQSQTYLNSKGTDMPLSLNGRTSKEFRVIFLNYHMSCFTCTHKLSFSVDILHICKVLTNTRARLWVTGSLELINSPRWCLNLLMRIFCFVKLVLNTFNSEATLVNPVFKFIASNPYSLWTSSERFRNINNVLLIFLVHIKLRIKILVVHRL